MFSTSLKSPKLEFAKRPNPEVADGGHFVQEWGDEVAVAALKHFGDIT